MRCKSNVNLTLSFSKLYISNFVNSKFTTMIMENIVNIYKKSLKLRPADRLRLMAMIAKSLDQPNEKIDQIWANEAENRYVALTKGEVRTIAIDDIITRYK